MFMNGFMNGALFLRKDSIFMKTLSRNLVSFSVSLAIGSLVMAPAIADGKVLASKSKEINGVTYQFEKLMDSTGEVRTVARANGKLVKAVPAAQSTLVDPALAKRLASAGDYESLSVNIALKTVELAERTASEFGAFHFYRGRLVEQSHNGKPVYGEEVQAANRLLTEAEVSERAERMQKQAAVARDFAARHDLIRLPAVQHAIEQGAATLTVNVSAAQLQKLIASEDKDIAGIELAFPVADQITGAMQKTNITSYALPYSNLRGNGIGIYMTESGCADEAGRTNYDRLAGSQTDHSQNVFGIMRAVSPSSFIYCRGGAVLPQASDLDGVGGNPAIRVINRSNGGNDSVNYSTLDRDWDNLAYNSNIAIFNAAGNNGTGTGNIISPAKGLNVMAVGNYNDSSMAINSSSSFVNTQLGSAKPEFTAPGTSIAAGGFTMTGTSMAAPHAAAFAADMMSGWNVYISRPQVVYASMIAGATDAITGGFDKVGHGGVDFLSTYYDGWTYYYTGSNASFATFDAGDGATDGYIDRIVNITSTSKKVRVAIAWMNRGSYTYDHRADAHPIGQDLDLSIYSPTGAYVGGSASFDNPFEVVNFTPTTTGNYKIRIKRYANRDTAAGFRLGLKINLY